MAGSSAPTEQSVFTRGGALLALLETMRPKQWTKNAVVFGALVFDGRLFVVSDFTAVLIAAVLFSLTSSSVYLVNDLLDADADRQHPLKRHRPIASGRLSPQLAKFAVVAILLAVIPLAIVTSPLLLGVLAIYIGVMFIYGLKLKHWVLIDVFVIAVGFVLRVAAGAVVIDVPISPWLYVCTVLLSLFIGFSKRRHELVLLEGEAGSHRRNLDEYSSQLLDNLIVIVAAATIMAYSLYTFVAPNLPDNDAMMLTIPFVLYAVFRYLYLVHQRDGGGAPEQMLLDDAPLLVAIILWGIVAIAILYVPWG